MQKILNQKLVDNVEKEDFDDSEMEDGEISVPSGASILSANSSPATTSAALTTCSSTSTPMMPIAKKKGRPRNNPLPTQTITPTTTPPLVNIVASTPINVVTQNVTGLVTPKGRFPNNPILKKKLLGLQKFLTEFTVAGRRPMALFMEKPSKKLYPDYYEVIQHPIDMNTIESHIKSDRYGTVDDVVGDYRLMFLNCRKYNEEGSMIYEDANILERALNEKLKEFSGLNDRRLTPKM